MTWLPGWDRVLIPGAAGGTHLRRVDKLCVHTTEGNSIDGAVGAYQARRVPPHATVDPWRQRRVQHIPLDRAAYSLHAVDQTGVIQVEIVGYAAESHTWPADALEWLGVAVWAPIISACPAITWHTVPTYGEHDVPYLAAPTSPVRVTRSDWDRLTGTVTHQIAPAPNAHWDPGRLNLPVIVAHARAALTPPSADDFEERCMDWLTYVDRRYAEAGNAAGDDLAGRRYWVRELTGATDAAGRKRVMTQLEQLLGLGV